MDYDGSTAFGRLTQALLQYSGKVNIVYKSKYIQTHTIYIILSDVSGVDSEGVVIGTMSGAGVG